MPNSKPANGIPSAAEFGLLRAYLAQHRPSGITPSEWNNIIKENIGNAPNNRNRAQIVKDLTDWARGW